MDKSELFLIFHAYIVFFSHMYTSDYIDLFGLKPAMILEVQSSRKDETCAQEKVGCLFLFVVHRQKKRHLLIQRKTKRTRMSRHFL